MKQRLLIETENVRNVNALVKRLLQRPRTEVPGLAVVYGSTGYGKTRWSEITAFRNGWSYMRMNRLQKEKSFLIEVYRTLYWHVYSSEKLIKGSSARIEEECIKLLQDNPDTVLFIDEINHKIHKKEWDILEIIRDFADKSHATLIMIGEQDTVDALTEYNPHFFARCSFFHKFKKNSYDDVKKIFEAVSEVDVSEEVLIQLYNETSGDLRKFVSYIPDLEFSDGVSVEG